MNKDKEMYHPSWAPILTKLVEFHKARKKIEKEKKMLKHVPYISPDRKMERK